MEYLEIVLILVVIITNLAIHQIQKRKIEGLEETTKQLQQVVIGQSSIINDFEKYKSLFDIEDFEKRLKLKLDNQSMQLNSEFNIRIKEVIKTTVDSVSKKIQETEGGIFSKWDELSQIAIGVVMKEFPKKEDKVNRDKWIERYYPENAEYFIGFIDHYFFGENK